MSTTVRQEREVTWQELAALLDEHDLTPGYSTTTGRAFVEHDAALVWADARGRLDQMVPGSNRLQLARIQADMAKREAEDVAYLATLTADQRAHEMECRRKFNEMPDPPDWQMERELERQGRL